MFDDYKHDDFDVVRTDQRYGGFEEVKLKNQNQTHTRFFRKSLTPEDLKAFDHMMELQTEIMKDGCSGAVHPMYTHNGLKWVLMSIPEEHYSSTALAS